MPSALALERALVRIRVGERRRRRHERGAI